LRSPDAISTATAQGYWRSAANLVAVKDVNALMARRRTEPPVNETTRQCPECLSEVPIAARRCAFCTSQLAA
jgi:hypothetical protein